MKDKPDARLKRIHSGRYGSDDSFGMNGAFIVRGPFGKLQIISGQGDGWEHVSVTPTNKKRCPFWEEMVFVKDLFWTEAECVIQYHPAKRNYINVHDYVLHLWKPIGVEIPTPPRIMV